MEYKLTVLYLTVLKFGIAYQKSLIWYSQMAESSTNVRIDVILYEAYVK